ncbi:hypothetical protein G6F35_016759 [Rhizopus arrhizus]|nr:hypothetical protein G6F35_016759 [Rhizopus arrhizus]
MSHIAGGYVFDRQAPAARARAPGGRQRSAGQLQPHPQRHTRRPLTLVGANLGWHTPDPPAGQESQPAGGTTQRLTWFLPTAPRPARWRGCRRWTAAWWSHPAPRSPTGTPRWPGPTPSTPSPRCRRWRLLRAGQRLHR